MHVVISLELLKVVIAASLDVMESIVHHIIHEIAHPKAQESDQPSLVLHASEQGVNGEVADYYEQSCQNRWVHQSVP